MPDHTSRISSLQDNFIAPPGIRSDERLSAHFDALRERLFTMRTDAKVAPGCAFVTALFSRAPREGVSTIASGLACSIAQVGALRALLITYERGQGRGMASAQKTFPGFAVGNAPDPLATYIEAGAPGWPDKLVLDRSVPTGFAGDSQWDAEFLPLLQNYQIMIVDAGSLDCPIPLRWGRLAHRMLLVVDTSRTTEEELWRLKTELVAVGQSLDGIVLSKRNFHVPGFLYRYVS